MTAADLFARAPVFFVGVAFLAGFVVAAGAQDALKRVVGAAAAALAACIGLALSAGPDAGTFGAAILVLTAMVLLAFALVVRCREGYGGADVHDIADALARGAEDAPPP